MVVQHDTVWSMLDKAVIILIADEHRSSSRRISPLMVEDGRDHSQVRHFLFDLGRSL